MSEIKERIHFEYGNMYIALSGSTGRILELYTKRNYDNVLKNSTFKVPQPFCVTVKVQGEDVKFTPLECSDATNNPYAKVKITSEDKSDGVLVKILYSYVTDGKSIVPCDLFYTVYLRKDDAVFSIDVKNIFGGEAEEINFPVLPGIYLGKRYSDDTLVFPSYSGMKYDNPVEYFYRERVESNWRWLDYRYNNMLEGIPYCERLEKQGQRGLSGIYPGGLSMSWMDLYDKDGGLYFGVHDPRAKPCRLEASTYGKTFPGVILSSSFKPRLKDGDEYVSPDVVIALHSGDWHDGADMYRDFRLPLIDCGKKLYPEWSLGNSGLFAHYDFKYQTGEIVHRYSDIPRLAAEAAAAGFSHMLFAGWQLGGHDGGVPLYECDPDLGTEEELIEGIRKAKAAGVHVTFYINFHQANVLYFTDELEERAFYDENGEMRCSYFGNRKNKFANMCPCSVSWKNYLLKTVERLTDVYGADGIYFDVLACGTDECYNPKHNHAPDEWMKGKLDILNAVRDAYFEKHGEPLMLLGEWTCDLLGGVMSYQLNQLYWNNTCGGCPTVFRYTFPSFGMTDMLYPAKRQTMRAPHVSHGAEELMSEIFTNGCYFWVYDLVDVNTFEKDPESYELLKGLIKLRKIAYERMPNAVFKDTVGIKYSSDSAKVTRFSYGENKGYLAVFRFDYGDAEVELERGTRAVAVFPDGTETPLKTVEGSIVLPKEKSFIVFYETE